MARDHLGPWDIHLNKLGKDYQTMLHTEFQASKPSRSEEEDFILNIFLCFFYDLKLGPPGVRPSKTLRPSFEQTW